jgi:hypothetical protein
MYLAPFLESADNGELQPWFTVNRADILFQVRSDRKKRASIPWNQKFGQFQPQKFRLTGPILPS